MYASGQRADRVRMGWLVVAGLITGTVMAQNPPTGSAANAGRPQRDAAPAAEATAPDVGYDSTPPLDFYERNWRWFTRHTSPQRFSSRDLNRLYGYAPPFGPGYGYGWPGRYGSGFGTIVPRGYCGLPYAYDGSGQAYVQGRYDERRYREWQQSHDKGQKSYLEAMSEGVRQFRAADYSNALQAFIRAARVHQGDPASRLHAAYAMVALGNYSDAALMVRRAMQLQSKLLYLPLDIRSEYGPDVDFEAHLRKLRQAVAAAPDDPALHMLLAFYQYCSGERSAAVQTAARAAELAPEDRLIAELHSAARMMAPSPTATPAPDPNAAPTPVPKSGEDNIKPSPEQPRRL